MALRTIMFDPTGDEIRVDIEYRGLVAASYTFILWEANSNAIVTQIPGNNQNPQDDSYRLPTPVQINKGRLIDIHSTIRGLYDGDDEGNYKVIITVSQDGNILDQDIQPEELTVIGSHIEIQQYYALLESIHNDTV